MPAVAGAGPPPPEPGEAAGAPCRTGAPGVAGVPEPPRGRPPDRLARALKALDEEVDDPWCFSARAPPQNPPARTTRLSSTAVGTSAGEAPSGVAG